MTNEKSLTEPKNLIPENVDVYNCLCKSNQQASSSYTQITSSNVNWILPIPINLDYNSDYNWSEEDTSWLATTVSKGAAQIFNDADDNGLGDSALNVAKNAARGIIQKGFAASDTGMKSALKGAGNLAYNPNKQLYFNEVTMREFNVVFSLSPVSKSESEMIKNGFTAMAKSAAPGFESSQFFFTYPDLFNILVKVNGVTLLSRSSLAITNLSLDLSSDGPLTWHEDGFPTSLQLSISFKESQIPTKTNLKSITLFGKSLG